jgi:hypothetical protein
MGPTIRGRSAALALATTLLVAACNGWPVEAFEERGMLAVATAAAPDETPAGTGGRVVPATLPPATTEEATPAPSPQTPNPTPAPTAAPTPRPIPTPDLASIEQLIDAIAGSLADDAASPAEEGRP